MPTNDNWKVSIVRDRSTENSWTATAKRDDFEFSQKIQSNEGEITLFCKTARAMYADHIKDLSRAKELEDHFDDILESEDKREAAEFEQAVAAAKIAADKAADEAKAEFDRLAALNAAKAQAEAEAVAVPPPAPEPAPVEPTPEPIQDVPQPEEQKNETPS